MNIINTMNAKKIILSDLESDIDKNKLEPVDRWIINDNGKQISVQIENCIDEQVIYTPPFDKGKGITLFNFIEKYCTSVELIEKKVEKYYYDSSSLRKIKIEGGTEENAKEIITILTDDPLSKGVVAVNIGDFFFKYRLPIDQQSYNTVARYSNILGEDIHMMNHKINNESHVISIYCGNGFIISFNEKIINIAYLFGYYNTITKRSLSSAFHIDYPDYITMQDYGIRYIGDIKYDQLKWMDDTTYLTFDLTLYNNQKNKEFTKGLVALPFMMSSIGISIQSEMFIPMRRTEIKDDETRVVYNYLYRL